MPIVALLRPASEGENIKVMTLQRSSAPGYRTIVNVTIKKIARASRCIGTMFVTCLGYLMLLNVCGLRFCFSKRATSSSWCSPTTYSAIQGRVQNRVNAAASHVALFSAPRITYEVQPMDASYGRFSRGTMTSTNPRICPPPNTTGFVLANFITFETHRRAQKEADSS